MSAVAAHAGIKFPSRHCIRGDAMDSPKRNLEQCNTKLKTRCSLVISCGCKVEWWLEETHLFICERTRRDSKGRSRGRERERSEGFEVHDLLEIREGRAQRCFICCHRHIPSTALTMLLAWCTDARAVGHRMSFADRRPDQPPPLLPRPSSADYPILFITCPARRRGPWTTKPPLFTSRHTTPTRLDHLSLPSSLLPTTTLLIFPSHQPIAFQKRRSSRRS